MRPTYLLAALCTVFACAGNVPLALAADGGAHAATTGSIAGRVQHGATGAYLEGAVVTLEPGGQTTLTTRDGAFYFSAVPAGEYRVSASYTGLDPQTARLEVATGQTVMREIALTSKVYAMDAFTVAGEREGSALAITQQRNAANIKNVISADAFGNIADQNLGNLLMRLPGVAEEILEGEVTSVAVRGISADFNAVTLDGTRGASGNTGELARGFAIDRIPADFVEQIEVTKALTPDMDGDSIGGAINLRTKSPLDRKGRMITYMAGTSWNLDRDTFRPIGSVSYSDTLGPEQKVGVLFTASYNKTHKPRDSVYQNWPTIPDTGAPTYFWMSNVREDYLQHQRIGAGLRFDYKLSPSHRISLNTLYSDYDDVLDRRDLVIAPTAAQVRPGWTSTVTETFNHPITWAQLRRQRGEETFNVVFAGEKRLARGLLDYGANFSHAVGAENRISPSVQVAGPVGFHFDRSDPLYPTMRQISGPSIFDRNEFRLTAVNFQDYDDTDTIRGTHLNWKQRFSDSPVASFKTGLRWRGQARDRRQTRPAYVYVGPDRVAGRNPATGINDDNIAQFDDPNYRYGPAHGRYVPNASLDYEKLIQHVRAHPEQYTENLANTVRDALQFNGKVTEDVYAGYFMGEARLGRLDVTTGVRVERTELTGRGVRQEITPEERARRAAFVGALTPEETIRRTTAEWSNIREDEGGYLNILPSAHFKYRFTENLQGRLSYSSGIGRPNFSNLLRTTTVNHDTMRVVAANSDLRPQTTDNYDLSLEYYFEPAGYLSAGVFLKEIKDFIYGDTGAIIGEGPDNGFDGDYAGYSLTRNVNGGSGRVRGFELAYNQRFTWLPGLWKGLGISANYTKIESRGNYSSSGGTQTNAEIAGFMPETFNASLSYAYRAWDAQVKYTYRAENLRDYNANPLLRVYYYSKKNVDVNLKYKWRPWLTVFVDVINVFDDPIANAFVYTRERLRFNQVFTPAIKTGVSGRF